MKRKEYVKLLEEIQGIATIEDETGAIDYDHVIYHGKDVERVAEIIDIIITDLKSKPKKKKPEYWEIINKADSEFVDGAHYRELSEHLRFKLNMGLDYSRDGSYVCTCKDGTEILYRTLQFNEREKKLYIRVECSKEADQIQQLKEENERLKKQCEKLDRSCQILSNDIVSLNLKASERYLETDALKTKYEQIVKCYESGQETKSNLIDQLMTQEQHIRNTVREIKAIIKKPYKKSTDFANDVIESTYTFDQYDKLIKLVESL